MIGLLFVGAMAVALPVMVLVVCIANAALVACDVVRHYTQD